MPIRPEMREFYPSNWPQISRRVRFERAAGICQGCNRRHGMTVHRLPDGRAGSTSHGSWRTGRGRPARWPDLVETAQIRQTRARLNGQLAEIRVTGLWRPAPQSSEGALGGNPF